MTPWEFPHLYGIFHKDWRNSYSIVEDVTSLPGGGLEDVASLPGYASGILTQSLWSLPYGLYPRDWGNSSSITIATILPSYPLSH